MNLLIDLPFFINKSPEKSLERIRQIRLCLLQTKTLELFPDDIKYSRHKQTLDSKIWFNIRQELLFLEFMINRHDDFKLEKYILDNPDISELIQIQIDVNKQLDAILTK